MGTITHFKIGEVRFLVECGRLQAKRVDDIVNLYCSVFKGFFCILCRWVCTNVDISALLDRDQLAIDFVHNVIDQFSVVPVFQVPESTLCKTGIRAYIGKASETSSSPVRMSSNSSIF